MSATSPTPHLPTPVHASSTTHRPSLSPPSPASTSTSNAKDRSSQKSGQSLTPGLEEDDGLSSSAESELSDVEEDEDEDEDMDKEGGKKRTLPQPSSFYPNEHTMSTHRRQELHTHFSLPPTSRPLLRPEDDPFCSRGIPIFTPTLEEFSDFEGYMNDILPWGQRSGIVKVVPPEEWKGQLPGLGKETVDGLRIKNPIQQNMQGISGLYRQNTIEKRKTLTLAEWFLKCTTSPFVGPGPKEAGRRMGVDERSSGGSGGRSSAGTGLSGMGGGRSGAKVAEGSKRNRKSTRNAEGDGKGSGRGSGTFGPSASTTVVEGNVVEETVKVEAEAEDDGGEEGQGVDMPTGQEGVVTVTPTAEIADAETSVMKNATDHHVHPTLNLQTSWLPPDTTEEDYTIEACRELERKFWRGLSLGEPSWYGADLKGSLFTEETQAWNVAKLPNLLNRLKLKTKLPGVNTTYLYFGMWAAAFAWHVEDCDLWSINYIHFGAPKQWYSIPPAQAESFERKMAGYFPQDARQCKQFLRHKSFVVSPAVLARDGCRPNVLVQKQGEYVITYPRGYHSGYNLGFNCAESINFALDSWIELGRRAQFCSCVEDSVRIDVDAVLAESALLEAIENDRSERKKVAELRKLEQGSRPAKRIRADGQSETSEPRKRKRMESYVVTEADRAAAEEKARRIKELSSRRSCIFCPDTSNFPTLPIHDPPERFSRAGIVRGHIACARSIPELWVEEIRTPGLPTQEMIMGSAGVARERWLLKCSACTDKKDREMGAKIQCTKGKCTRAFHVTCAMQQPLLRFAELETEEWVATPGDGAEGCSPSYELVRQIKAELLCSQHNPASHHLRKQQADLSHRQQVSDLQPGAAVELRWSGGYKLETVYVGPIEGVEDIIQVLSEDGLPLDVPINRVFPIRAVGADDHVLANPPRYEVVLPREEIFKLNPVDFDQVALTPKLCLMLSENPLLRAMLDQLNGVRA